MCFDRLWLCVALSRKRPRLPFVASLSKRKDRSRLREKQRVAGAVRDEFHMLIGLALIEFKTEGNLTVQIHPAKLGAGDCLMSGYRRAASPRRFAIRKHRGARQS